MAQNLVTIGILHSLSGTMAISESAFPHVFYTGLCPNQQVEPAVTWLHQQGKHRFYLLGSDYVFPRTINEIIKAHPTLQSGEIIAETYVPLGTNGFQDIIEEILEFQPEVVLKQLIRRCISGKQQWKKPSLLIRIESVRQPLG